MASTLPQTAIWHAARTRHGCEGRVRRTLDALGVENFIPFEKTLSGASRPVIPCLVFLRATRDDALSLANSGKIRVKYLIDCATHTLMTVPDKQMDDFRRVMEAGLAEGGLVDVPLEKGEAVRVIAGPLKGVEGTVLEFHGRYYVVVGLLGEVFARAQVPRAYLEKI